MKSAKRTILILAMLSLALFLPTIAQADWDPGQSAKWVQMPDLTPNGMDVDITLRNPRGDDDDDDGGVPYIRVLADDFECTQT